LRRCARRNTSVRLNSPLQAHPWKRLVTAADEPFAFNHPADGQIYTDNYGSLRPARRTRWGNGRVYVTLAAWLDSQNQLFQLEGGSLRLGINGQSGLCLALNLSDGIPTGRPIHLRRDMTPEYCDSVDSKLARWATGIFDD